MKRYLYSHGIKKYSILNIVLNPYKEDRPLYLQTYFSTKLIKEFENANRAFDIGDFIYPGGSFIC